MGSFRQWWLRQTGDDETPLDGDAPAFLVSFLVHLCAIVSLGLVPMASPKDEITLVVSAVRLRSRSS